MYFKNKGTEVKVKHALAAGLLLGAGLAHAQSNVTLYGIVDTGIAYYNNAATGGSFRCRRASASRAWKIWAAA